MRTFLAFRVCSYPRMLQQITQFLQMPLFIQ